MKNFHFFRLTFLLVLFFNIEVNAQYTIIPDVDFEQYLIDQFIDSEGSLDGQVLTSDVSSIISLDVSSTSISDLTGIHDFVALRTLKASQTNLSSIDVNGLTNLQDLDLSMATSLTSLNVEGCTGLLDLDIRFTNLNTLDLSTCTSISTIDLYRSFSLQQLDVSGKTSLTSIIADESSLRTLNVSGCTSLSTLRINETSISTLDLSHNPSLINFSVFDSGIQSIDLSNCINLESLSLTQCQNLSSLNLTSINTIKSIILNEISSQIISLDISSFSDLESLYIVGTAINSIDATNSLNLNSISIYESSLNSLDLRNGNNNNITELYVSEVNLNCISVDDEDYSTTNWTNIDDDILFSNDCSTLSSNDYTQIDYTLYPNPSTDYIYVSGLKQHTKYQIYSIEGKAVNYGICTANKPIEISNLASGIYFLKLDALKTIKFIKK
ncbi:T9SS type A sorting domain-containing protein [Lacinutrix iliipiscaria]|uniref:T9SS type A sorting domain-containing protein n=1 Tax=Lacinutrix iliipiscaria TaxID=1230532 RepID=A0ABW5WJ78_9FLAO